MNRKIGRIKKITDTDQHYVGRMELKGLDFYVDGRVKSLTNGQQTPVSIAPGGLSDFSLAGVGK